MKLSPNFTSALKKIFSVSKWKIIFLTLKVYMNIVKHGSSIQLLRISDRGIVSNFIPLFMNQALVEVIKTHLLLTKQC